ncbi:MULTISPECIES: 3-deoxy-manno-octulosonate cytidylyltransferase [unclassified Streptomyces]|uniref:3-deoxy-manno-octulosonate cytidylyltransferase n=1 Tax=unclassified Streptomyces TaxID=2593676 RepID=UPI002F90FA6A
MTGTARTWGVIPARYGSTRLPGKVLCDIAGRPMIEHVWRRAMRARSLEHVLIATDDERVAAICTGFGAEVAMTSPAHISGTDRVAEATAGRGADIVVNIQGDEPLLDPDWIDQLALGLLENPDSVMATLASPISDHQQVNDPGVVKVVFDATGRALYFSRSPIPYERHDTPVTRYQHIGLYAYRTSFLTQYTRLPPAPLEQAEGLEQLRALHHGHRIHVITVEGEHTAIDTLHDLQQLRTRLAVQSE